MKLPLEYNILSDLFDLVGSSSDISTNRAVERILKKYKAKTILDLTCGTGSQVIWLSKKGFNVVGSDYSANLLAKAKAKLKQEKIKAKLFQGDMRTQKLGKFDAVITIFNAIGHLTPKGFEKAIRNIHRNLKDNGIYVFDIFNLDSLNAKDMASLDTDKKAKLDDTTVHIYQYSTLDKKKGLLVSHDNYTFTQKNKKPKKYSVKFPMQIYSSRQLRDMLTRNGFEVLEVMSREGSKFSENRTKEMITVARRIPSSALRAPSPTRGKKGKPAKA